MKPDRSVKDILRLDSVAAAPLLLGCVLTRQTPDGVIRLRIVETEAYHQDDPASHSFRGPTSRTAPMFEAAGTIYVYFTYGMHYCMNLITGPKGVGEGVLLRAAEPISGLEIVRHNRGIDDIYQLANGPGKLTMALGLTSTELSGTRLGENGLSLEAGKTPPGQIVSAPRIGIRQATDKPWRFYIKDNPYVSRILKG